ncbi:MAG: anion permease [Peptococcaceae bacterium]|jgi:anion transporter|nr:anion permease [Peptococcaceae bacterium]
MNKAIKYSLFLVLAAVSVVIGLTQILQPAVDARGHAALATLLITIGLWIFKPLNLSFSASSAFFMAVLLAFGVPAANVFAGFASTAVWTLIPALFFGFALAKTGLGKRIAYFGMKSIRVTYVSLIFMWTVVGVVLSMLTPSMTVRVVIVTPIALQCAEICRLPEGSKARSLILITAWAMAVIPGIGWLTGSLNGPILSGFYAAVPELGAIDFASWVRVSLLPVAVIIALTAVAGYFVLRPAEELNVGKDVFQKAYRELGPVSPREKATGIILIVCFIFFTTSSIHHIPDAAVCLLGLFALAVFGIIEARELSSGINWDLVIFIGTAMSFASVFSVTGLASWVSGILVEAVAPVAGNPYLFVFTVLVLLFLWRFVDVALLIPTMAIVSAILPEVSARYHIDPLVWVPLLCIPMNAFFLSYTNMFALAAEANMGEKGWTGNHLTRYGVVYFAASMLVMLVAVPYWISIGMFGR